MHKIFDQVKQDSAASLPLRLYQKTFTICIYSFPAWRSAFKGCCEKQTSKFAWLCPWARRLMHTFLITIIVMQTIENITKTFTIHQVTQYDSCFKLYQTSQQTTIGNHRFTTVLQTKVTDLPRRNNIRLYEFNTDLALKPH